MIFVLAIAIGFVFCLAIEKTSHHINVRLGVYDEKDVSAIPMGWASLNLMLAVLLWLLIGLGTVDLIRAFV